MKTSTFVLGALVPFTYAFPARLLEELQQDPELLAARTEEILGKRQTGADAATGIFEAIPTFDARRQLINVGPGSGHEWRAPGPNDLRGVCPGLNAFSNHGFLPRSGVATITQYVDVTTRIVGMGPDLALFLAVLGGLLASGDLVSWSMGGTPGPNTPRPGGLLGTVGGVVGGLTGNRGNGLSGTVSLTHDMRPHICLLCYLFSTTSTRTMFLLLDQISMSRETIFEHKPLNSKISSTHLLEEWSPSTALRATARSVSIAKSRTILSSSTLLSQVS